ncbi:MAG: TonB-dependent receptor [Bacteroidales bacterium]|nr:TonB-dependent receptor [Bacteroidales bacterium]
MKKSALIIFIAFSALLGKSQTTVSGFVYDAQTKEAIIGANIIDSISSHGTTTNSQAYYVIRTNSAELKVSFIGYETQSLLITQLCDTIINIFLVPSSYQLDEVTIHAESKNSINVSNLEIKEISQLPSLGGQTDIIKSAQVLPGIQSQSEASSLLIVRGGDPGQNMFLLDNTSLIYVNHLGGFMSVFNPDIINDITVYKAGFPARYGGKLSSIIDITQRSGNSDEFKGSFGIGITDVNLCLEGKFTNKFTYILTARKTLFDVLLLAASGITDGGDYFMTYGFHDINFKSVWRANGRNTFALNVFQGDDYLNVWNKKDEWDQFNTKVRVKNIWGNFMSAASWNCIITPKIFSKTNLSYSRYRVSDIQSFTNSDDNGFNNQFSTKVQDISLNSLWSLSVTKDWMLVGGLHLSYFNNTPFDYEVSGENYSHKILSEEIINSSFSLSNNIKIFKFINAEIGTRIGNYYLSDTSQFFIEPRLDLNVNLNKFGTVNINYMHVNQASHLLISSGNIYANEIWIPSSKDVPISNSIQTSLSWTKTFGKNMFDISIGVYHKELSNLVASQKNVYDLTELENWKQSIEIGGIGEVNGLEFMLKKSYGKWTGLISYHLSKSTRIFNNVNNGNEYFYEYNRPHDLTIFINKKINDKLSFSLVWNYQTGLPYTPVLGRQMILNPHTNEYYEAFIYGLRNSATMKDYHRLDIGLKYETLSKKRKLKTVWTFSIYNAYNRQNPSYYYYNNNSTPEIHRPENGFAKLDLYQMSLFPILPSVSYKVYFGKPEAKQRDFSLKKWLNFEN